MGVSFIMPAYKAAFLHEAIESIVHQSVDEWELVIVDDCSPEDLQSIVALYPDKRVKYYRNTENIGGKDLVAQWNHCVAYAEMDWVVLAADDDVYAPSFCEEVLKLSAIYPDVKLIRSRVEQIDTLGRHLWEDPSFPEFEDKRQYLDDYMSGRTFCCVGNFAFRRSALTEAGGFVNFPCGFCSDIATPVLLSGNGVANTSALLFKFRQSPIHLSASRSRLMDKLDATTMLFDWLAGLDYMEDKDWLHSKCIYDYFNHVLRFVPLKDIPRYLGRMKSATAFEKAVMCARWTKRKLFGK